MSIGIYKITSPSGKVYVGQSKNIEKRFLAYKRGGGENQHKLLRSFRKYGALNHKFEILEVCSVEMLNDRECHYITLLNTWNTSHGLNLRSGGAYGKMTDASNEANRIAHLGKKHSQETKDKMKAWQSKRPPMSAETGRKISEAKKGIKFTKEHIEKLKESWKNSEAVKDGRRRKALKQGKKVINTITGKVYNSAKEAAAAEGYLKDSLTPQLNGHQKNRTHLKYL